MSPNPRVSVVIPVYNDPAGVEATLRSLADQTYAEHDFEVVVVDNNSTDDTADVARLACEPHANWRVVVETTPGSYAARNAGIAASDGDIVAFVDADMTVDEDWLDGVVSAMGDDVDYLACDVDLGPAGPGESLATRYQRRTAFPIRKDVEERGFAPTCCLVVRRRLFDRVGTFDETMQSSGDKEFGNRVRDAGIRLRFAPNLVMHHPPRTSVRALVKKARRIGRGRYQLRRRHDGRYGHPMLLVLNPLAYTPPTPGSMRAAVEGWDDLPRDERLRFYGLATLLTLARARGKWTEAAADLRAATTTLGRGARRRLLG